MLHPAALLNAEQSREADRAAIAAGTSGTALMENAGRAITDVICESFAPCPTLVVCGTGNNGGDGFVTARLLKERGWLVIVGVIGDAEAMRGEAGVARHKWETAGGSIANFDARMLQNAQLVVDALIGTGLQKNIEGAHKAAINAINDSKLPVVAVDIASGVNANDGTIMGVAVRAAHTVTFVRPKIGHVLLPGKDYTGQLHVFDIGISGEGIVTDVFLNIPALWRGKLPTLGPGSYKYSRGYAIIMGGGIAASGASRMAALAALRAGAGLSSVACTPDALPAYVTNLTAVMTKIIANDKDLDALLSDERVTAICIGPGYGVDDKTQGKVLQILKLKKSAVLDADALTAFKTNTKPLFAAITGPTVMTPHEGEFKGLFSIQGNKMERTREAAKQSSAVVVFKGNDTVIAAPDGRLAINAEAPVWLATAGSGDVLSGIITGLLAQGMPAFEAACAGVWIHSRAAALFGPGLIAEDIPDKMPDVWKELYNLA